MNIYTTPIALQRAGAKFFQVVKLEYSVINPTIYHIIVQGKLIVTSTYEKKQHIVAYNDLAGALSIQSDSNSPIYLTGNINDLQLTLSSDPKVTLVDISKNHSIQSLTCSYCSSMETLIASSQSLEILNANYCGVVKLDINAPKLSNLSINYSNGYIGEIVMNAGNEDVCNTIIQWFINMVKNKTVTVYAPLTYAEAISTAATNNGWTYKEA